MARVKLEQVRKVYANGQVGVAAASFEAQSGELLVLVGPSGCGKTTTLRMIAGLEAVTSGTLTIGERVVNDVAPKDRDIAMVFQSYALYPHMTVAENLAFGLKLRGESSETITQRVREAADLLGLHDMLDRQPRSMSGGQRQRVALGRALVRTRAIPWRWTLKTLPAWWILGGRERQPCWLRLITAKRMLGEEGCECQ